MGVRTRHVMRDSNFLEERVQLLIFTPLIRLESKDFGIKLALNESLEVQKHLKHIGPFLKKIDPRKLAIIIYETHIICVPTNRGGGRPPHIRKHKL